MRRLVDDPQVNAHLNARLSQLCADLGYPERQWVTWHRDDERAALRATAERFQAAVRALGAMFTRPPHIHNYVPTCTGCGQRMTVRDPIPCEECGGTFAHTTGCPLGPVALGVSTPTGDPT